MTDAASAAKELTTMTDRAPSNLVVEEDAAGIRIGFGEPDWLGPGTRLGPSDEALVEVDVVDASMLVLRLHAQRALSAATPEGFAHVGRGVRFRPSDRIPGSWPAGMRASGQQYTEFGLPTQASEGLDRWYLLPSRPPVVMPLWLCAPDGRTLLLAPLDSFHEQVITVPTGDRDAGISWGWHGDLDEVPAGFTSSLVVLAGDSPRGLLERWASLLDIAPRLPVDVDTLGRQVSYWTDNGAAYWYRTEPPRSVSETIGEAVRSIEGAGIPVGAVQVDSWFYPHEELRPFDTDQWEVPPTGLVDWAPRPDILPEGLDPLHALVERRPLVAHCRHLSRTSPLLERFECWVDGAYAHPTGRDYYEHLLDRAAGWGVETFEHDWLVECFLGVRGLRAAPGRAQAWQEGLDDAAAARDMTLQWCMATPADAMRTTSLRRVTSIRTSGDHGYLVGSGFLWAWFCYGNAMARVLGLAPFKDVFLSTGAHAEVEALLSALSTGPVGVGDPIGSTDAAVVAATCRADGVIVRPDVPIAAVDACFRQHAVARPVPLVAECHTDHPAGRWTQVFSANTYRGDEAIAGQVDLGPAWPSDPFVALDLRTGEISRPDGGWEARLEPLQWTHHLLAPVLTSGEVVFGDISKHAPVGRARFTRIADEGDRVVLVLGGAGETVTVDGWSPGPVRGDVDGHPADLIRRDDGRWSVDVPAGSTLVVSSA